MANMLFANNCNTTLSSSITNVATTMSVTSATGFPSPTGSQYFYCTLADAATQTTIEIVKVTAVSGTTFTITRGQDGTSGTAFASGAVVSLRLVRASLNDFPKLDEANTFTADQAITGQLTTSAGLATTNSFTATAPADGLVMDYATGFGRFSAFAGDGFQWYNAGVANTKLMQLSSTGVITTATWNGTTVGVAYGGTGLTSLTAGYIPFGNGTSAFSSSSSLFWDNTNGRLGIGSSSPDRTFYVYTPASSGLIAGFSNGYTNTNFYISASASGSQVILNAANNAQTAAQPLAFAGNGTEWGRFDTSGNLLVGTTTNSTGNSNQIICAGIIASGAPTSTGYSNVTSSQLEGSAGRLVANHVNGTGSGALYAGFGYNGGGVGSITQNGTTGVLYNLTSDYRLKNNPAPLTGALDFIMALQPKTWDWWDGSGKGVGFIAHEFMEVAKYSGNGKKDEVDAEGNPVYQSIQPSSSEVMANLVSLVQEQQTIITNLKTRLTVLEAK